MVPTDLSTWIQRAGRAGRDGRPSRAILLVEPSVAKKLAVKSSKPSGRSGNATKGSGYFALGGIANRTLVQISKHGRPLLMGMMPMLWSLKLTRMIVTMKINRVFRWVIGKNLTKRPHTKKNMSPLRCDDGY